MHRFISFVMILSLIMILMACFSFRAWAGSGITTVKGDGTVVDLTVFFGDTAQNPGESAAPAAPADNWKTNFIETSRMLHKATGGKLRLGTIRIGTDPSVKGRSDVEIYTQGHASVDQPGSRVLTSLGSPDTVYLFKEDRPAPIVTLHELGHYLFTLSDEYMSEIWGIENGVVKSLGTSGSSSWCSTKNGENHDCVMYDNSHPDLVYLFCSDKHLAKNELSDGRWAVTDQQRHHKKSCCAVICEFLRIASLPAPLTTDPPETPSFVSLKPEVRLSVFIQGTLSEADMKIAKKKAAEAVRRLRLPGASRDGDSVGVSTFATSVEDIYGWKDLASQSLVDAAVKAINDIKTGTGTVDLEASLRSEMTSIVGSGYAFSAKTILLFTNGPGKVSQTLIDEMRRNDVVLDVVALADNANTQSLKALAVQTGGRFTALSDISRRALIMGGTTALLFGRDEGTMTEDSGGSIGESILGGYLISRYEGTVTPGTLISQSLPVDSLNNSITVEYSADTGPLALALKNPSGTEVNLDAPPEGTRVQKTDNEIVVTIESPAAGTWTALLDGTTAEDYMLELSGTGASMGESQISEDEVNFPAATILSANVENGQVVTGCQVQALITHPDDTTTTLQLFDDGNEAFHGDAKADDGTYSNYLTSYSASGACNVEFQIINRTGQYSTAVMGADVTPGDGAPGPTGPAPVFERIIQDSFIVTGVPAGAGTALLPPGGMTLQCSAPGQVTLAWTDTNGGKARTVIQRSVGESGAFQEIGALDAGTLQYTDMAAGSEDQVQYRLIARGTSGDSGTSEADIVDMSMVARSLGSGDSTNMPMLWGTSDSGSKGFCFIATAAYGSYLDPHVRVLRNFRDRVLLTNGPGRFFVRAYYALSPPLAQAISPSPLLRLGVCHMLSPLVFTLEYPVLTLLVILCGLCIGITYYRQAKSPV